MNIEEPFRLVYTFGDAFDPANDCGSVVAQLFGDGRVLVDNVFGGAFTRSWEGLIERSTAERILTGLEQAGFPSVEDHHIPPGATLRVIAVKAGGKDSHHRPIEWSAGREMKGYGDAFRILDSLIAELTQGAVPMVELAEPGLVRRATQPSRPAVGLDEAYDLGLAPALVMVAMLSRDAMMAAAAEGLRKTLDRLLQKYGRSVSTPTDPAGYEVWAREAGWAAEELVSGPAAESFALGRAVGQVRLALEERRSERSAMAIALLQLSRHAPAVEIAALALRPPAHFRPRLDALSTALRRAIGA